MDHIQALLYSYATLDESYQTTKDVSYKKSLTMMRKRLRQTGIEILEAHADRTHVYVQYLYEGQVNVAVIERKALSQSAF